MSINFVLSPYLGGIAKFIFIYRRLYSELQLYNNFILYKYILANPRGHAVKGVCCNSLISEIVGLNPAYVMDVRLLCFVLCFVGSDPCDVLVTGID